MWPFDLWSWTTTPALPPPAVGPSEPARASLVPPRAVASLVAPAAAAELVPPRALASFVE